MTVQGEQHTEQESKERPPTDNYKGLGTMATYYYKQQLLILEKRKQ